MKTDLGYSCILILLAFAATPAVAKTAVHNVSKAPTDPVDSGKSTKAQPISAADPLDWGDQTNQRALNGHFFLPSEAILDPFTTTHFGSMTAFGYGRFDVTAQDDDGNEQELSLKVVSIQQAMDLQVQVGQVGPAAFALRARASGSATVGIDAQSALYLPITLGYEYGLGLLVKPWGNRYFQFGLSLDFSRGTTYSVSPVEALNNSINSGTLTADGLLTTSTATRLEPALSLAVSPHRLLGLVTTLRYAWSHPDGSGADGQAIDWGLALGFDLGAVSKAPIGFQAVYQLQKPLDGNGNLLHYGGGGLFYTGRPNLSLGAEVLVTRSSPAAGVEQLIAMGQFRLRYYW